MLAKNTQSEEYLAGIRQRLIEELNIGNPCYLYLPPGEILLSERLTGGPSESIRNANPCILKIDHLVTLNSAFDTQVPSTNDPMFGFDITSADGTKYRYIIPGSQRSSS